MKEEKVEEIKIDSEDMKLHIRRKNYSKPNVVQKSPKSTAPSAPQNDVVTSSQETNSGDSTIKTPITGVFYRSPSPTSPMFVKEGDVVNAESTLCIIEAMKVMNEIKATEKVKIIKILVENGQSVDSQQDLFVVEKI
jgi:acetyl-CoA carboxylase biotin carboxyl carrier protein